MYVILHGGVGAFIHDRRSNAGFARDAEKLTAWSACNTRFARGGFAIGAVFAGG